VKLAGTLAFIIFATFLPADSWWAYLALLAVLAVFIIASKVGVLHYLQALLVILPLLAALSVAAPFLRPGAAGLDADKYGLADARLVALFGLAAKTIFSYLFSMVLLFTTSFTRLMEAFEKLGIPKVFVMTANFAYRYQFVIVDEAERLARSRNSRLWQPRFITQARTIGWMAGALFVRSYERSERIYMAMASRGFDGSFRPQSAMRLGVNDLWYAFACAGAIAGIWVWLA
jgi:cobalt/nickel transport system permease protein